jgi:hypothetical protein
MCLFLSIVVRAGSDGSVRSRTVAVGLDVAIRAGSCNAANGFAHPLPFCISVAGPDRRSVGVRVPPAGAPEARFRAEMPRSLRYPEGVETSLQSRCPPGQSIPYEIAAAKSGSAIQPGISLAV